MEHMIWQLKSLRKCLSANMPKWLRLKNVSFFGSEELSVDAIEDMHWRMLCKTEKIYAMNNAISLFGDSVNIWNLDKFTNMESNIHHGQNGDSSWAKCKNFNSFEFRKIIRQKYSIFCDIFTSTYIVVL